MATAKNLEIEIKLQLSCFTDYLKLLGFLGPLGEAQRQLNGFFDTSDRRLSRNGWALRVRVESNRGLVTVKGLAAQGGTPWVRREIETEIERGKARELLDGYGDLLQLDVAPVRFVKEKFPGQTLEKLVQFRNERQSKQFRIGDYDYLLEVDRTEFSDGSVEYELEVELEDESRVESVEDRLRRIFQSLDIPFEMQQRSKFERALEKSGLS